MRILQMQKQDVSMKQQEPIFPHGDVLFYVASVPRITYRLRRQLKAQGIFQPPRDNFNSVDYNYI